MQYRGKRTRRGKPGGTDKMTSPARSIASSLQRALGELPEEEKTDPSWKLSDVFDEPHHDEPIDHTMPQVRLGDVLPQVALDTPRTERAPPPVFVDRKDDD